MAVVIADDQERERTWLAGLLSSNFANQLPIHEASDGQKAVELALKHKPPLVLLDIEMPLLSGIKASERILKELPSTAVIILSNHSDEIFVRQLWKIVPSDGAFGYVLKDSSDQQVVDAIKAVLGGDCWIHPRIQRIVRRSESGATGLTDAEFEVLAHISLGLTDKGIAKRLYITEKAVQARLKCLYSKLALPLKGAEDEEFNQRCRALNVALRRGLINKSELDDWENRLCQ